MCFYKTYMLIKSHNMNESKRIENYITQILTKINEDISISCKNMFYMSQNQKYF